MELLEKVFVVIVYLWIGGFLVCGGIEFLNWIRKIK